MHNIISGAPGPIGTTWTMPLNDDFAGWVNIISCRFRIDSTATAGNRYYILRIDGSTGPMWSAAALSSIGPSKAAVLSAGQGAAAYGVDRPGGGAWQTVTLPVGFAVPPGAILSIHDDAAIDPADQIVKAVVLAQA